MDMQFGQLSKEVHNKIYLKHERKVLEQVHPVSKDVQPTATFLAGQPGSGKRSLMLETVKSIAPNSAITIDVDDLRELHPMYRSWQSDPATERLAAPLTHQDASDWGKQLMNTAIKNRTNIIIDGTLGNAESTEKQFTALKEAGYKIEVKGLAVHESLSRLGVYERFEAGKDTHEARWVPPEVQENAYRGLPHTLAVIEQNQEKYDARVQVFNRAGDKLYDNRDPINNSSARDVLEKERNRPMSLEEHQTYTMKLEGVLKAMQTRSVSADELVKVEAIGKSFNKPDLSKFEKTTEVFRDEPIEKVVQRHPDLTAAYNQKTNHESLGEKMVPTEYASAVTKLGGQGVATIVLPQAHTNYAGKVIQVSDTHIVQRIDEGRAVAHDVSKLTNKQEILTMARTGAVSGKHFDFKYSEKQGIASVSLVQPVKSSSAIRAATPARVAPTNDLKR